MSLLALLPLPCYFCCLQCCCYVTCQLDLVSLISNLDFFGLPAFKTALNYLVILDTSGAMTLSRHDCPVLWQDLSSHT